MPRPDLHTAIEYLKGVGEARGKLLREELRISCFGDLLRLYPHRYIDRSRFYRIAEISSEETEIQLTGRLTHLEEVPGKGRQKRLVAHFRDGTGQVELVWFRGVKWIRKNLQLNQDYVLFGKPQFYRNRWSFPHPELELLSEFKKSPLQGLQPVYPSSEKLTKMGLHSRAIGRLTRQLLPLVTDEIREHFPPEFRQRYQLPDLTEAYRQVHFPSGPAQIEKARCRLKFDEFFFLQLELLRQKQEHARQYRGYAFEKLGALFHRFYEEHLPFALTGAQKRVVREVRRDVMHGRHMNRLLQGDVGSGKTIVALLAMLMAADNDFQACLMAPTEILAQQHYQSLRELAGGLPVEIALLTGSSKAKERKDIHKKLVSGEIHLLIGTHALIEPTVEFKNLGLAVVDEQHRFGVAQREALWKKNKLPPHVLVMTATPIPRTLAMSVYGNLDISVIDELPPGRKTVETRHYYENQRLRVFGFLKEQIARGRQVYMVYPLIEESEHLELKDLMEGYESVLRAFPRPDYQVSVVHGRMKSEDKEFEMQRFAQGKTHIMVATTVIEVGVNVPNASVMVIENANRFGLSQLHQLRGRVGRGADQSYCLLMTDHKLTADAKTRLKTMVDTTDGFKIAEVDMQLRGPGDLMGTRQSGLLNLQIANLAQDAAILQKARSAAVELLQSDPGLKQGGHADIRQAFQEQMKARRRWSRIS